MNGYISPKEYSLITLAVTHIMKYKLEDISTSKIQVWDDAQARKLDKQDVAALARSIDVDGLQSPPLLQKQDDGQYMLITGQRRLAAMRMLGKKTIPALVLQDKQNIDGAKAKSLTENIHRRNMNAVDISKTIRFLVEQNGKGYAMKVLGMSKRTLERYLGFDALPEKLKEMVPNVISKDHATRVYKYASGATDAIEIADLISGYDEGKKDRYIRALADNPNDSHDMLLRKSNRYYSKMLRLGISDSMMRKLASESETRGVETHKLVSEIVQKWLQKR